MSAKDRKRRLRSLRDKMPEKINLAGDTAEDRQVWHSYLRLAWDAYYNWTDATTKPFPGSAEFAPLEFRTRCLLASIVFSVCALEYRMRSTEDNIVRVDLAGKGKSETEVAQGVRDLGERNLKPLLEHFWNDHKGKKKINSADPIDGKLQNETTWVRIRDCLVAAVNLRNKFAHGDPVALGELLPLNDPETLEMALEQKARDYYNCVIDAMAYLNFHTRYSAGKNEHWKTVEDAIREFTHLKIS